MDTLDKIVEPNILTLGLTGGIGSGKSYIARLLEQRGIPVYDSDMRAKALYGEDAELRKALEQLCGSDIYDIQTGQLNRGLFASRIFTDRNLLSQVNALVHPAVRRDFVRWRQGLLERGVSRCALESALLLDSGLAAYVDRVLVVVAPMELRLERAMRRDQASEAAILQRMSKQQSQESLVKQADYVLYNDGTSPLEDQIGTLLTSFA